MQVRQENLDFPAVPIAAQSKISNLFPGVKGKDAYWEGYRNLSLWPHLVIPLCPLSM